MDKPFKSTAIFFLFLFIFIPVNSEAFFDDFNDSTFTVNNWTDGTEWNNVQVTGENYAYQGIYNSAVNPGPGAGSFAEKMKVYKWSDIEIDVLVRIDDTDGDADAAGLLFLDEESYEHDCTILLEQNDNRFAVWNQGEEIAKTTLSLKTKYWYRLRALIGSEGLMDVYLHDANDNSILAEMKNLSLLFPFEEVQIAVIATIAASYDNFTLIYENGSTVRFQAGEIDNFEMPAEQPIPDPQLLDLMDMESMSLQWFDQIPGINGDPDKELVHTFKDLSENIIGATLEISVKAGTEDVADYSLASDGFNIFTVDDFTNPNLDNVIEFGREFGKYEPGDCGSSNPIADPGFLKSGVWSPGDAKVFNLDLSNLPLIGGGSFNFIPDLNKYKNLTLTIGDETGVDYILLTLETDSAPIPSTDNDGDGYTIMQNDCDDNDSSVHPNAEEVCNDLKDNDCDTKTDCDDSDCDNDPSCQICTDSDGDGYYTESGCGTDTDCNDSDAGVNPGASEICEDSIDQNCDGKDDDCTPDVDDDGDGVTGKDGDCDDTDASIYPGAKEICGDGIDQDCKAGDLLCPSDIDDDNDGYTENQNDCNDSDFSINPGATEVCGDGIDQNCDGKDDICQPAYDATGDWNFTQILQNSDCTSDVDSKEKGTLKFSQNGNSFTVIKEDRTYTGTIDGATYTGNGSYVDDGVNFSVVFTITLSSGKSGTGTVHVTATKGSSNCSATYSFSMSVNENGGGGGGCFITVLQ